VFTETKGGTNPYFMTGAGGVLQSVIFGFGGFNIGEDGIYVVNQTLPAEWKKLTIKYETNI
jgi:trehalose/maltose hydrolase-like predicted phosphorylase